MATAMQISFGDLPPLITARKNSPAVSVPERYRTQHIIRQMWKHCNDQRPFILFFIKTEEIAVSFVNCSAALYTK
ncbi:hypothetical protein LJC32_06760 [Oscillospiraceae bacterium OttesenSCG-928-F05]|nr:hypothetical protein [Oscillospiraceae bacterium OttesenSCG-928-F05]